MPRKRAAGAGAFHDELTNVMLRDATPDLSCYPLR
jgi:hypothetical protein